MRLRRSPDIPESAARFDSHLDEPLHTHNRTHTSTERTACPARSASTAFRRRIPQQITAIVGNRAHRSRDTARRRVSCRDSRHPPRTGMPGLDFCSPLPWSRLQAQRGCLAATVARGARRLASNLEPYRSLKTKLPGTTARTAGSAEDGATIASFCMRSAGRRAGNPRACSGNRTFMPCTESFRGRRVQYPLYTPPQRRRMHRTIPMPHHIVVHHTQGDRRTGHFQRGRQRTDLHARDLQVALLQP
ncbi:hypothetical protein C7413_14316 [Paraburkholderia silvatlantica]|nr:hypothetical protein C7411_14016 [Paraburkholderia silvatlantica]PXW24643.1 hypothetical protein C7413_14316 [Paraburkholderia silvatlantica]TDQ97912.1 hypothetical protein C7412_107243 [Paraburkholderia silvatlantica]